MKKIKFSLAALLFVLGALTFPTDGNANCFSCIGVNNDAYCDNTVCQYVLLNNFECNMHRSSQGNCNVILG